MPTVAQRENCERARSYFKEKYAGKITNEQIRGIKEDFCSRFGFQDRYWQSKWLPELRRINGLHNRPGLIPTATEEQEGSVEQLTIELPLGMDSSIKEQINKLLTTNQELSQRLEETTQALAPLRKRSEFLKKLLVMTIEQL